MLTASRSLEILERYRIPYDTSEFMQHRELVSVGITGGPRVFWPRRVSGAPAWHQLGDTPVFARTMAPSECEEVLRSTGRRWHPEVPVGDADSREVSSVWRSEDGSRFLPFDPDEATGALLGEFYVAAESGLKKRALGPARGAYYRVRPLLPRRAQLAARRRYLRVQMRTAFPAWPTETAFHALEAQVLSWIEDVAGEPLPWVFHWPRGYDWAAVLTHDVERQPGYSNVDRIASLERELGLRSAFYFVPERDYEVEESQLRRLRDCGFEVCLHGLHHDGRDLSAGSFERRLPAMRSYARDWGAVGFRSPATHRDPRLLAKLGLDHDSSYSDVARFEPQAGGCCSWLPFFIDGLVELPMTMPMDHTLFELLGQRTEETWLSKASFLRDQRGMAMLLTHPDYLLGPAELEAYERYLRWLVTQDSAWQALPHEVSEWWRRRAASTLERRDGQWEVVGPAAEEARAMIGAPAPPGSS